MDAAKTWPPAGSRSLRKPPEVPRWAPIFLVAAAAFMADQATKCAVIFTISLNESVAVWAPFFRLTHIHNPGAAFGIFAGRAEILRRPFFVALSVFAVAFILYLFQKEPRAGMWRRAAFGLILGGAIGNLADRLRYGAVVDFLHFSASVKGHRYEFAVFNVADSAICVGVGMLILEMIFGGNRRAPAEREPVEESAVGSQQGPEPA